MNECELTHRTTRPHRSIATSGCAVVHAQNARGTDCIYRPAIHMMYILCTGCDSLPRPYTRYVVMLGQGRELGVVLLDGLPVTLADLLAYHIRLLSGQHDMQAREQKGMSGLPHREAAAGWCAGDRFDMVCVCATRWTLLLCASSKSLSAFVFPSSVCEAAHTPSNRRWTTQ